MPKIKDTFKNGHYALVTWADWKIKEANGEEFSPLGYPDMTGDARYAAGAGVRAGTPGPVSPNHATPRRVLKTQRAVETMPEELQGVVRLKYLCDGTDKERLAKYREATGKGKQAYYDCLEQAKAWVMGVLLA